MGSFGFNVREINFNDMPKNSQKLFKMAPQHGFSTLVLMHNFGLHFITILHVQCTLHALATARQLHVVLLLCAAC